MLFYFPEFIEVFKVNKMCKKQNKTKHFLDSFSSWRLWNWVANPVLHFLVAHIAGARLQDLALESPLNPADGTSNILPTELNFQILVFLIPDEILGSLFQVKNFTRHLGVGVKLGKRWVNLCKQG